MLSFFDLIAEKNRVWKNDLPSLSYRYAALKVRGCDPGDRVLRGIIAGDIYRTGSCPLFELKFVSLRMYLPRKEVIQPHLPVRLPCYDLVLITDPTFDSSPHKGWATGFGCYRLS